jgi:hypothetical protein
LATVQDSVTELEASALLAGGSRYWYTKVAVGGVPVRATDPVAGGPLGCAHEYPNGPPTLSPATLTVTVTSAPERTTVSLVMVTP